MVIHQLHLRCLHGIRSRFEQHLAAPLAQRLSAPGRRLLTLPILRFAELGPQRPAPQLLRRSLFVGRVHVLVRTIPACPQAGFSPDAIAVFAFPQNCALNKFACGNRDAVAKARIPA